MTNSSCPAISVIIPFNNAEKYIGECLDSLLNQTFKHFEVIVVNNCSTDSSCAIVESYASKFNELTLAHMEYNTGNGAVPRNEGLKFSRGEYVFFMDADDLVTPTALEEMYTLAKDYDADALYFERHYEAKSNLSEMHIRGRHAGTFVEKPTFETADMTKRLQELMSGRFGVTPWIKAVRRNLLLENEIFFPRDCAGEDEIWTFALVFYAKKFLRVPNAIYIQRLSEDSMMRRKRTPSENMAFRLSSIIFPLKTFDELIGKHEFFQQNPQYRYAVLEWFIKTRYNYKPFFEESFKVSSFDIYSTIKQKFGDKLGEWDVVISALCTALNTQQKISAVNQQKFNQFAAQAKARIAQLEAEVNRLKNKE